MRIFIFIIALISSSYLVTTASAVEYIRKYEGKLFRKIECTKMLETKKIPFDDFNDNKISFDILTHEFILQSYLNWSRNDSLGVISVYQMGLDDQMFETRLPLPIDVSKAYKMYSGNIYIPMHMYNSRRLDTKKTIWEFNQSIAELDPTVIFIHTVKRDSSFVEFCRLNKNSG
jgi:hypothetical protein